MMENQPTNPLPYYSHQACVALFDQLFANGFLDSQIWQTLTPQGWSQSPLVYGFHPTVEQVFEETLRLHQVVEQLVEARNPTARKRRAPTLKRVQKSYQPKSIEPEKEMEYLLGLCLWDIFSNEHEVVKAGQAYHLGSWRGTGSFLAQYLSIRSGYQSYDYMDFYMGTWHVSERCDLTPVYQLLFQRLRQQGCDWIYNSDYVTGITYGPELESDWVISENETQKLVAKVQQEIGSLPFPIVQSYVSVYGKIPAGYLEAIKS